MDVCLLFLKTVAQYTPHKMCHLSRFEVYGVVALSTFTLFVHHWNQHRHASPDPFHLLRLKLCTH